jgi:hypothetical protein
MRKGCREVNMVEILYTQVLKYLTYSKNGRKEIKRKYGGGEFN